MDEKRMDERLDDVFCEALTEEFASIRIPDPDTSWERLSPRISRQARRQRLRKRLQLAGMLAAAVMLGAFLFGSPQTTEAFLPVTRIWNEIQKDVLSLFQGDSKSLDKEPPGMLTAPPPHHGPGGGRGENVKEHKSFATLDEAREALGVAVVQPGYTPPGYSFTRADAGISPDGRVISFVVFYRNEEHEQVLVVNRETLKLSLASAVSVDKVADASQKVKVGEYEGAFIAASDEAASLIWNTPLYNYYLFANRLDEAEMIRVAESMP